MPEASWDLEGTAAADVTFGTEVELRISSRGPEAIGAALREAARQVENGMTTGVYESEGALVSWKMLNSASFRI